MDKDSNSRLIDRAKRTINRKPDKDLPKHIKEKIISLIEEDAGFDYLLTEHLISTGDIIEIVTDKNHVYKGRLLFTDDLGVAIRMDGRLISIMFPSIDTIELVEIASEEIITKRHELDKEYDKHTKQGAASYSG